MKMIIGGKYNWYGQKERLVYLGKGGSWNQFAKIESPDVVWCEVLDRDLHMLEETKGPKGPPACSKCKDCCEVTDTLGFVWPCPYCTPFDPEKL